MLNSYRSAWLICLIWSFLLTPSLFSDQKIQKDVYLLVNSLSPDSKKIADYYCEKRGVPVENIIELAMPKTEVISIRQYVVAIHNPLIKALLERGIIRGVMHPYTDKVGRHKMSAVRHSIKYLITTTGVPLKFSLSKNELSVTQKNAYINSLTKEEASVDSELSAMLMGPYTEMKGYVKNPEYQARRVTEENTSKNIRISRLDGPSLRCLKELIDDSLYAETHGLRGRAYVDIGGPYKRGDLWFEKVADDLKAYNFEVELETTKKNFGLSDRTDASAIYMGWYRRNANLPWTDKHYRVPSGAIAYHLHSFSALTLKSTKKGWVGPLLHKGFSATYGYAYEPLLDLTIRPDLFMEQLLKGASIGEAASVATPALSWQSVVIGDPLYRPFKVSLEEQLSSGKQLNYSNYAYLNQFYKDKSEHGLEVAIANAEKNLREHPNLALMKTLADAYYDLNQYAKITRLLKPIKYLTDIDLEDYILVDSMAQLLNASGDHKTALEIYKQLHLKKKLHRTLELKIIQHALPIAFACNDQIFADSLNKRLLKLHSTPDK